MAAYVATKPADSLKLSILLIVDGENPKFLATVPQETLFLNCSSFCPRSLSQSGEPHPFLVCEPFEHAPFIPNHDTII